MSVNALQQRFALVWNNGGIASLKLQNDRFDSEYVTPGETLGEVLVNYRVSGGAWRKATTFASGDIRRVETDGNGVRTFTYSGEGQLPYGLRGVGLTEKFSLEAGQLLWTLHFQNETGLPLELGDIGLPLPFNRKFVADNLANYTRVVARHSFISGHGSF